MGLQRIYFVSRVGIVFAVARAGATCVAAQQRLRPRRAVGGQLGVEPGQRRRWSCTTAASSCRTCHSGRSRPVREEVLKLLNYGKYVLLSNIGDKIVFATDAMVIGMFLPIAALTPYAIAGTLINQMRSVVMAMASVFNPLTSSLRATGDEHVVQRVLQTGAKGAMIAGLPLVHRLHHARRAVRHALDGRGARADGRTRHDHPLASATSSVCRTTPSPACSTASVSTTSSPSSGWSRARST